VPGGRGLSHEGSLRNQSGATLGTLTSARASGGDGQILSSHDGERVRELIEGKVASSSACRPIIRPISTSSKKRSPSPLKALLRKAGALTCEALIEAMGWALEALTAKDARGFFEHRGDRATAQLL